MLKRLHIQNLAVVEDVVLEFDAGLNVLTGSTGAGKSLVLGAVNLLLGHRASAGIIRAGKDRASVEGHFITPAAPGSPGGEVTLKREVRRGGRSAAFVNGTPVSLKQLHDVCSRWIEPHGQNEQLRLRDPDAHVGFIDAYAGNAERVEAYREALAEHRRADGELADFERRMAALREKEELLRHRIDELQRAELREGELDELEASIRIMENSERIFEVLGLVYNALEDDEAGAATILAQSVKKMARVSDLDGRLAGFVSQLEEAEVELRDCVDGIRAYIDGFEFDADRLRSLRERRAHLLDLERRYGAGVDELIQLRDEWRAELNNVAYEDERRRALEQQVDESTRRLQGAGDRLSEARRSAGRQLDRLMTRELETLMISGARFRTEFGCEPSEDSPLTVVGTAAAPLANGLDVVRFWVRTNPGESEGPVDEIASTGEMSRISLALKKAIHTGSDARPVLVFDELDAGVGADLGGVIAEKLLELCAAYQIICITHMPQIAAVGKRHLVVAKRGAEGRTYARVTPVEGADRQREIARMLGGEKGSEKRLELAGEMLRDRVGPDRLQTPEADRRRGKKQKTVRP